MQPPESSDGIAAQVIYLVGIGLAGAIAWISQYRHGGKSEEEQAASSVRGKQVVLESAELADLSGIERALRDLAPRLDAILSIDQGNKLASDMLKQVIEANHLMLNEMSRVMRRLEQELDVTKRMHEERILAARDSGAAR